MTRTSSHHLLDMLAEVPEIGFPKHVLLPIAETCKS